MNSTQATVEEIKELPTLLSHMTECAKIDSLAAFRVMVRDLCNVAPKGYGAMRADKWEDDISSMHAALAYVFRPNRYNGEVKELREALRAL